MLLITVVITVRVGMLLELDSDVLHQLLRERTMLETAVHKAQTALRT